MSSEAKPASQNSQPAVQTIPELVSSDPDNRNWRGIAIALLVIAFVCALIVTAVVLLSPGDKGPRVKNPRIGLDEFLYGAFTANRFNGSWLSDEELVFLDSNMALVLYNVKNSSKIVLMSNVTFKQHDVDKYSISPDRKYVLLKQGLQQGYRHSYTTRCSINNISNEHVFPLLPQSPLAELQYVSWGPVGNQLVYVYENDIYYIPEVSQKPDLVRLTYSGKAGVIFNGIPDWIYEEEILSSGNAVWWSDKGTKLCFATFNDSEVDIMTYQLYGSYQDPKNVYTTPVKLRYPKPGKENPTVTLHVVDLSSPSYDMHTIKPPKDYIESYYFTSVRWVDEDALSITWLRRSQNSSVVSICRSSKSWSCEASLYQDTNGKGWISESYVPPLFTADKKHYFLRLPIPEDKSGRFFQIVMVDINGNRRDVLTNGPADIISILTHHMENHTLYYISTLPGKPGERHLFSVTDMFSNHSKKASCLTCKLDKDCLYNNAIFSMNATYYVLECLGPGIPKTEIRTTHGNHLVKILDKNEALKELVNKRALPQVRTFQVSIEGGYKANARLFLPPGLKDEEITKYPMLVHVYGGPGSQMITEKFDVHWGSYLASKKNYIYALIDGRGSGNRGEKILHEIYRRLGSVEVEDQISVARYLKNELPFIDKNRVGIWGWSYGGYVSAMALAMSNDVFNCGISVAPVTSWLYYDSVYTERYMQMPDDNVIGYEKADLMKKAGNIKGKKFLLVHGTADDNVHIQQSMMLMKALTDADVLFRSQVYPDESHSLGSVDHHLYRTLEDFLSVCFMPTNKEEIGLQKPKGS